ncbi:MAG: DUF1667 domain-containing protein [Clostridia bacterium]|nr:DUF1667 domain-containing protein [Clostridia bacterium]MBQ1963490.1 DUF1667 domain-containing protein [Clostridia bacterium]
MVRELTCIVCPKGCPLRVELEDGVVKSVTGHTCPRGLQYANDECIHPMRTVTSTVLAKDGRVIPVKTDRTIPKEKMFECMELINATVIELPVTVGQVLLSDILGTGANLVATANADESL